MNGWLEVFEVVCQACTALRGEQVTHKMLRDTRPPDKRDLSPFVLGVTTESP